MGKKSRVKRQRREAQTKRNASGMVFSEMRHPFAGIPKDKLARGLTEAGRKQAAAFEQTSGQILKLLGRANQLDLLSALAAYGLTASVGDDGAPRQVLPDVLPAHIEIAQALCLKLPQGAESNPAELSHITGQMFRLLKDWSEQFHWKRLAQLDDSPTDAERARLSVREFIRNSTQSVRNWGYYHQVKRIASELIAPLDDRIHARHGFTGSDAIAVFDYMFSNWSDRIDGHFRRVGKAVRAETMRDALANYKAEFPEIDVDVDGVEADMRMRGASLKNVKYFIIAHSDLQLHRLFTFTAEEISRVVNRPVDVINRALTRLAIRFSELRDENTEHFFLNNPVWTRPVVDLGDGRFFCVMPQSFFAFYFEIALSLVRDDGALRNAYDRRRSEYLETSVERVFLASFPGAELVPNLTWRSLDQAQQFESDLLVKVDSFLFIVESKSGRVSPQARRGADASLEDSIDQLLVEPSRQSARLANTIEAAQMGEAGAQVFAQQFPFDLQSIRRIVRLSVTLEDVSFLQTNVNGLKDAGFVPANLLVAPSVTLADLEIVFEILRSVPERLHYWVRRGEWEGRADYLADEMDLLGVYLKTGLDLGNLEFGEASLMLVGMSKPIDEYYEARREGIARDAPQLEMTQYWRDMVARIQAQRPERWTEGAVVLMSAGVAQQEEFLTHAKHMVVDVRRRRERAGNRNIMVFTPARGRREAVAFIGLLHSQVSERHELMHRAAARAFEHNEPVRECVVIALDVDETPYPYNTLGVFLRPAPN